MRFYYGYAKQGISRDTLPYKLAFQPYYAWASLGILVLILITSGWTAFLHNRWSTRPFVSAHVNALVMIVLYIIQKLVKKAKLIPLEEMPIRQLLGVADNEEAPLSQRKKGWRQLKFI